MRKEISCGSSCVKYIIDKSFIYKPKINYNMFWITEIALYLKKNLYNDIEIYCYKSNLYQDFEKNKNNNFIGVKLIKECLKNNLLIIQKKLTKRNLKTEIINSKYIILCVESKLLNNNNLMIGGHYIIITDIKNDIVSIINPQKENYEFKKIKIEKIISYSSDFGSWRILVKNKEDIKEKL